MDLSDGFRLLMRHGPLGSNNWLSDEVDME
jgi:hypothetical protein